MIEKFLLVMAVTWFLYALVLVAFVYFAALSVRQAGVQMTTFVCGGAVGFLALGWVLL